MSFIFITEGRNIMEYLGIFLRALLSLVVLFVFTKLLGKRQISDLSLFDYINGMTIGSIAAEMATGIERNIWVGIIGMGVYGLSVLAIDIIDRKSIRARRFFSGTPTILYENGTFKKKNFARAQISISEFQEMCRINGYYYIDDIESAQMESNGKLSVLPKVEARAATVKDLSSGAGQGAPAKAPVSVIYDGRILSGNLKTLGFDERWLEKKLAEKNVARKNVFLATADRSGSELTIYLFE